MSHSRLTQKRQATIPKNICAFLNVDSGDVVSFVIEKDKVLVRKADPIDAAYHRGVASSLQSEWLSKEDSDAYDDL